MDDDDVCSEHRGKKNILSSAARWFQKEPYWFVSSLEAKKRELLVKKSRDKTLFVSFWGKRYVLTVGISFKRL